MNSTRITPIASLSPKKPIDVPPSLIWRMQVRWKRIFPIRAILYAFYKHKDWTPAYLFHGSRKSAGVYPLRLIASACDNYEQNEQY
ncbi:hypothetical protein P9597_25595 [Aneurinibacillus migulanus]|uniref:hypothetical protein n=1 Tax=Aneurinibacillus migulanus TaxID=47500 RepID=UPI002E20B072|nr:hypothetical protein [Aneurinibacillus migulanus]